MSSAKRLYKLFSGACFLILFGVILAGCSSQEKQTSRLRIVNSGSFNIKNLVVRFPEDQIEFGDVPAGATTEYVDVPNGVYRYAAYQLEVDGEIVTQPVVDFIGEEPMSGTLFTYTLDFDTSRL
ncbi:MAG: hypothetical protein AB1750_02600, partial [Chloroflexota bacterium]